MREFLCSPLPSMKQQRLSGSVVLVLGWNWPYSPLKSSTCHCQPVQRSRIYAGCPSLFMRLYLRPPLAGFHLASHAFSSIWAADRGRGQGLNALVNRICLPKSAVHWGALSTSTNWVWTHASAARQHHPCTTGSQKAKAENRRWKVRTQLCLIG